MNASGSFIATAEDSTATTGETPKLRGDAKTAAEVHFEMAVQQPYRYTEEQILFAAELAKKGLDPADHPEGGPRWQAFFGKGQPCLRTSPLGKRYGWGIHIDRQGRVAAVASDSAEYRRLSQDPTLKQTRAMRTSRK